MELNNEFEVGTEVEEAWRVLTDVERIAPCLPGAELREIEGDEYRGVVKVKVGPITAEYRGAAHFVELDHEAHRAVLKAEGREARGQGNASATITAQLEPSEKGTRVTVVTDLSITGKVAQFGRGVLADVSTKLLGQFVENLETMVLAGEKESAPAAGEAAPPADAGEEAATPASARGAAKAGEKSSRRASGSRARRATAPAEEGEATEPPAGESTDAAAEVGRPSSNGTAAEPQPAGESEGATVRRLEPRTAEPVDLVEVAGSSIAKRILPLLAAAGLLALIAALIRRRRR